jgi:hypothetical protein
VATDRQAARAASVATDRQPSARAAGAAQPAADAHAHTGAALIR